MTKHTVSETLQSMQEIYGNRFELAVVQAAATMENPAHGDRLQKARDFVLRGAVTLHDDGTASVTSDSQTYHLDPACTCPDSQQRSPWCKHALAVELLQRTAQWFGQHRNGQGPQAPQDDPGPTPAEPHSQRWAVNEAPASCCLKFVLHGIEILYTMRDVDDDALFVRVGRVLPKLEARMDAQRQQREQRQAARHQEPGTGGHDRPEASGKTQTPDADWCDEHQTAFQTHQKNGQTWQSHRTDEGTWCRRR